MTCCKKNYSIPKFNKTVPDSIKNLLSQNPLIRSAIPAKGSMPKYCKKGFQGEFYQCIKSEKQQSDILELPVIPPVYLHLIDLHAE